MDKAVAVKLQPAGLSIIFEKISPAAAKHLSDKLHAMQALAHSQEQHSITFKLKSSGWMAAKKNVPELQLQQTPSGNSGSGTTRRSKLATSADKSARSAALSTCVKIFLLPCGSSTVDGL